MSEINTLAELREARRELALREWFAKERLQEDVRDTFTLDTLLSIVAPSGSVVDRVIGGVGTGFAAIQGVLGAIGSLFVRKGYRSEPAARAVHHRATAPYVGHTGHTTHAGHTAHTRTATRSVRKKSAPVATRKVAVKRTPEIEVEVDLEKPRVTRSRKKS